MANVIINQNRDTGYTEYVVETVSDLNNIPNKEELFGCTAFCIENQSFYIMNNNSEWELASSNGGGGSGGTSDYTELSNKPSINGVTLSGNKTSTDLGITSEDFIINVEMAGEPTYEVTADKTYAEVEAAYAAGKQLFVNFTSNGGDIPAKIAHCNHIPLDNIRVYLQYNYYVFTYSHMSDGYMDFGEILIMPTNVSYNFDTIYFGG